MSQLCKRDTDNDGNCEKCHAHGGCPFSLFRHCDIDRAKLTDEEVRAFKKTAVKFEYTEWLGTIHGWRDRDGRVLIEQIEPK